jgi:hypothetical protein
MLVLVTIDLLHPHTQQERTTDTVKPQGVYMIKVPGNDNQNKTHQVQPLLDDSFDPTRDDWSRHEESGRHHSDGLGFRNEDDDSPSWFEEDDDDPTRSEFDDLRMSR